MNIDQYMLFNKERHVAAKSFFIRFILIMSFGRTFSDEFPLNSWQICGDKLFKGSTSLTLALKRGLCYRMGAVTLNLFPG